MSPATIDTILRGLKHFGPYGLILGYGVLGYFIFVAGDKANATKVFISAGEFMMWVGGGFCFLSLISFGAWHFFQWPPWMAAIFAPPKATKKRATVH
jgi:hypothetical protein